MVTEEELDSLKQKLDLVLLKVKEEVLRAVKTHGMISTRHEGASIVHEEYDEFWDEVKRNSPENQQTEGIQLSAMAALYVTTFYQEKSDATSK